MTYHQRLEDLFSKAVTLDGPDLEAFLDQECDGEPALRADLEDFLRRSSSPAQTTLSAVDSSALHELIDGSESTNLVGQKIGSYEVERVIASGGMGTVLAAIQRGPNRRVALKLIRPELFSPALVRRFSLEVEVLGRLQHANIAQVYDGGSEILLGAEVPFFAMEFIANARPIHTYVHQQELDIESTLRLFCKVCDGIMHAHFRGVIHRDLKPDNILVDSEADTPQPKIIDFGIARLTEGESGETGLTSVGQIIGTLETMSPEQARGNSDEIDIRTDVYALGVILFQMLTQKPPLRVREKSIPEAIRIILEDPPDPASAYRKEVRPELDAILLKSLSKERSDRYESVGAFQDDIHAFLEGRTVSARIPSTIDIFRIAVRRYRTILAPVVIVFLIAIVAAVVSTRFAIQARHRAEEANRFAYGSSISAVTAALEDGETAVAEAILEQSPPESRGWEWHHLSSRLHQESAEYGEYSAQTGSVSFGLSDDGKLFASGTYDSGVKLWDVGSAKEVAHFELSGVPMWIGFEGASTLLVREWSEEGERFHRFAVDGSDHDSWALSKAMWDPILPLRGSLVRNDTRLLPSKTNEEVIVYDLTTREIVLRLETGGRRGVVAIDRAEKQLATVTGAPGTGWLVTVFDVLSGKRLRELRGPEAEINALAFGADGRHLAATGADGLVYVWDLEDLADDPMFVLECGRQQASFVRISDDGEIIAAAAIDLKLRYWSLKTGELLGVFGGFETYVQGMVFQSGTRTLFTLSPYGPVRKWELTNDDPTVLTTHAKYVYPIEISEEGGFVLSGGWDGWVGEPGCLRWSDLQTGDEIAQFGPPGIIVLDADLSPDGTEAILCLRAMLDEKKPVDSLETPKPFQVPTRTGLLARVSMKTGELLATYRFPGTIEHLATDPRYERAVFGDWFGNIRVIDISDGTVLHDAGTGEEATTEYTSPVAWSPDGRWIAAVTKRSQIQIWDARTYAPVVEISRPGRRIWSIEFDAQSKRIITASDDRTVIVWSVPEGRELAQLVGHGAAVLCAKFSPDGSRIVSGGRGGEVRVWRGDTYEAITSLQLHDSYVFDLEWTADGQTLVTSSGDQTVRVWETVPTRHRTRAREERRSLVDQVMPSIDAAFSAGTEPEEIWREMIADPGVGEAGTELDERRLQVIWQEILRRALVATS